MRANLLLAMVLATLGFLLGLTFFILVNIQTTVEPIATWSLPPYRNMFQYAGLVCLLGAVIYLFLERQESSD